MLYAIGDVHGRFDLLLQLHKKIMDHSAQFDEIHTIVMLGDYVDRGPKSKEVIDFLMKEPFTDFNHVYLRGNHEDMMVKSIYGTTDMVTFYTHSHSIQTARSLFLDNGGDMTLKSFGIDDPHSLYYEDDLISDTFVPYAGFFSGLKDYYTARGYLFVHAGITPGISLEDQDPNVMYWIRDKFLNNVDDHEYMVIHGHTTTVSRGCGVYPETKPNRIGIDTGAYHTGVLTALCLDEAHERRPEVLNTHPDG